MRVAVRLVAYVGEPVPGIDPRGEGLIEVPEGTSLAGLLDRLGVAAAELYLAFVNDASVRQKDQAGHLLAEGDRVTVFPPIQGG